MKEGELYADAGEAASQFLCGGFHLFGGDIGGVGVELFEQLGQRTFHQLRNVDGVDVLVVNQVEEVHHLVAGIVDNGQPVAGEVVGKKTSGQDAGHHSQGDEQWYKTLILRHECEVAVKLYK